MFEIFTDSGANLPACRAEAANIRVIPFMNDVDGRILPGFRPGYTPEQEREEGANFYNCIRLGAKVKTSLINTEAFKAAFRPVLEEGKDLICITISSGISGTYTAAKLAAEDLSEEFAGRDIEVIDSKNASLASGIMALYADELRQKDFTAHKAAEVLRSSVLNMNGIFTVGSLKYLKASGRVSGAAAAVGGLLDIRPILRGSKDAVIVQYKKCRGRRQSLDTLVDLVCSNIVVPEKQIIGIAHADAYEESLAIMDRIRERINVRDFINTTYDTCTGSHVGPDTIALFFMGVDRELDPAAKASGTLPSVLKYL